MAPPQWRGRPFCGTNARVAAWPDAARPDARIACETAMVRKRLSRELLELHRRVQSVSPPLPPDDASDAEWDAWADLQDLQAILAGLVSRWGPTTQADEQWPQVVGAHLANPAVLALLGEAAPDARALAAALVNVP